MIFYGTHESINEWRELINKALNKQCTTIAVHDQRATFSVDLTPEERQFIQDEVWYRVEPNAPRDARGRPMAWNMRISFQE